MMIANCIFEHCLTTPMGGNGNSVAPMLVLETNRAPSP
jgi:hypothetical protein